MSRKFEELNTHNKYIGPTALLTFLKFSCELIYFVSVNFHDVCQKYMVVPTVICRLGKLVLLCLVQIENVANLTYNMSTAAADLNILSLLKNIRVLTLGS
ncbi:hypothetical protein CHS0354_037365 [Potamilus streckersoni]|uniref:Uncharacterized protein n=1 Tax=Potamilus streckersoni TaxID=2493646 RepID=A0AAE0S432_9BIVA|nr:hypothetical protein CHS0354_037365 [Potamilus streckersoni]